MKHIRKSTTLFCLLTLSHCVTCNLPAMRPATEYQIYVYDEQGRPIPNADVALYWKKKKPLEFLEPSPFKNPQSAELPKHYMARNLRAAPEFQMRISAPGYRTLWEDPFACLGSSQKTLFYPVRTADKTVNVRFVVCEKRVVLKSSE